MKIWNSSSKQTHGLYNAGSAKGKVSCLCGVVAPELLVIVKGFLRSTEKWRTESHRSTGLCSMLWRKDSEGEEKLLLNLHDFRAKSAPSKTTFFHKNTTDSFAGQHQASFCTNYKKCGSMQQVFWCVCLASLKSRSVSHLQCLAHHFQLYNGDGGLLCCTSLTAGLGRNSTSTAHSGLNKLKVELKNGGGVGVLTSGKRFVPTFGRVCRLKYLKCCGVNQWIKSLNTCFLWG